MSDGMIEDTALVLIEAEKHLTLYRRMVRAIDNCHAIDQCKDIADKSVALAAYYKQIKDDKTVQMFNEVRLRAWRRIGKLFVAVDVSACPTQSAAIKTVRAAFSEDAMSGITDGKIREILQLSAVSDTEFEAAFEYQLTGSIPDLLNHTPTHLEQVRLNKERWNAPPTQAEIAQERVETKALQREMEEAALQEALEHRHHAELDEAADDAMQEVGITLERKDRANMKQVVFLIKEAVHTVMRQAAHDQHITMQEILRRGLKMWLVAHDYKVPDKFS